MSEQVKQLAEWIINECGVEGLRNKGGKWQRINDEIKLQSRLERMIGDYLKETCQRLEKP